MTAHARPLPTFADVDAAAARIAGIAVRTPLINAPVLDERWVGTADRWQDSSSGLRYRFATYLRA